MDPDKQDALSNIENSIYRTAFKLRSVQTLCQLDLIDSSLIQHVLLHQRFWEARESSLSVQQLGQVLQELFQRAKVETTGEPHPRASELTLSLLRTIYDRGSGFLQLTPVAAALIALSGDSPLTKYRALFQLYAENKGGYDHEARMTRRALRNLLTDLQQIPAVVGESRALCSVESATRGCFQGVLSPAIKEERFLCWVQSEPLILLWLPTCYRLSATEMLPHPVRCSICRAFPIMGLRYRCLKCVDYNLCQMCFFSGLHNASHQQSHPVVEHCIQVSAKENTKFLFRTLRNNLLRGRYRRRDAMARQRLLDQGKPEHGAWFSIQYDGSNTPVHVRPAGSAEAAALGPSEYISQRISQAQQIHGRKRHHQAVISIRNELWRTRESMNRLHRDRRLLKKRLNHCKDKLQAVYTSQEEKNFRFEAKIHQLTANQNGLWAKLQQLRQDLQTMLQPHHPSSSSCQNMESKVGHSSAEHLLKGRDSSQSSIATKNGSDGHPLRMSAMIDRSEAHMKHALTSAESSLNSLQSIRSQNPAQKRPVEIPSSLPGWQEGLPQDVSPAAPTRRGSLALASVGRKATAHTKERRDEQQEEELQELLTKLLDTFSLERPSGPQSSENTDLYGAAERVCRAFSALMDQITLPKLK